MDPFVMPGLVPGIHVLTVWQQKRTWMAGTSPAMTEKWIIAGSGVLPAYPTRLF
jgi:hypothetical protein